jgi:hypothetical protein
MENPNAEIPKRSVLWVASGGMFLFTFVMYLFFDQRGWTARDMMFIGVSGVMTLGLIVTLIDAKRFWWGMRLVTFIIFATYLSYLLYEFAWSGKVLEITTSRGEASPFNSVLGFLFFGVPCLLYTFWGSTWGKLGHERPEKVSRSDVVNFYIAWGAHWLFFILSAVAVAAALVRG